MQEIHKDQEELSTNPHLVFLYDLHSVRHLEVRLVVEMIETMNRPRGGDGQDGDIMPDDEPPPGKQPGRLGFPPDDGDHFGDGFWGQSRKPVSINKWAKPLPKLDRPLRIHAQKASRIKQIWEIWSTNVAFALSTWHDLAVQHWHRSMEIQKHIMKSGANQACRNATPMKNSACMEGNAQSRFRAEPLKLSPYVIA